MKKYYFIFFLIIVLSSCQKSKDEIANNIIEKGIKAMQNAGEEVEIVKMDSLTPASLTFEETQEGVNMRQSINRLKREVSENLQFLKPWAGVANIYPELQEVNDKITLIHHLEDSLKTACSQFKFDKTMLMKSVVIKGKQQGKLISDTAYFFFDKELTKCVGMKAKDKGFWQYIPMSSTLSNE